MEHVSFIQPAEHEPPLLPGSILVEMSACLGGPEEMTPLNLFELCRELISRKLPLALCMLEVYQLSSEELRVSGDFVPKHVWAVPLPERLFRQCDAGFVEVIVSLIRGSLPFPVKVRQIC